MEISHLFIVDTTVTYIRDNVGETRGSKIQIIDSVAGPEASLPGGSRSSRYLPSHPIVAIVIVLVVLVSRV